MTCRWSEPLCAARIHGGSGSLGALGKPLSPQTGGGRLAQNGFGDSGVKFLFEPLKYKKCKIQTLEIWMTNLTDDCTKNLSDALSMNKSLKGLQMRQNLFTDRSISNFIRLLENCRSLEIVDLSSNEFSTDGKMKLQVFEAKLKKSRRKINIKV